MAFQATHVLSMTAMRDRQKAYDTLINAIKSVSIVIALSAPLAGWLTSSIWITCAVGVAALALYLIGLKVVKNAWDDLEMSWHESAGEIYKFEVDREPGDINVWLDTSGAPATFAYSEKLERTLQDAKKRHVEISFEQRLTPNTHRYFARNLRVIEP